VGCVELLNTVQRRVRPKLHVFGGIHEGKERCSPPQSQAGFKAARFTGVLQRLDIEYMNIELK